MVMNTFTSTIKQTNKQKSIIAYVVFLVLEIVFTKGSGTAHDQG
jgi:hypothetical protein